MNRAIAIPILLVAAACEKSGPNPTDSAPVAAVPGQGKTTFADVVQLPIGSDSMTVFKTAPRPPDTRSPKGDSILWTWKAEGVRVAFRAGKLVTAQVVSEHDSSVAK